MSKNDELEEQLERISAKQNEVESSVVWKSNLTSLEEQLDRIIAKQEQVEVNA